MKKNIQATNNSFLEKISAYQDSNDIASSFYITQQLFTLSEWNPIELEKRKKTLLGKINEVINIF